MKQDKVYFIEPSTHQILSRINPRRKDFFNLVKSLYKAIEPEVIFSRNIV